MIDLYRAELQKAVGNRWVTGFLLWIFPVGALSVVIFMLITTLLVDQFAERFFYEPPLWTSSMIGVWGFPSNILGQMFLIGFIAVTFAGEYQWGTWKNILPRHRRVALIAVKFVMVGSLILFTFVLMSLIVGVGYGLVAAVGGIEYGPELSSEVLRQFGRDYGLQAFMSLMAILITAVYAAFAAMLMRSILGGVLVGLGFVIVEPLTAFLMLPISIFLEWPNLLHLVRFTPTYNIDNIRSWVVSDGASNMFAWMRDSTGASIAADSIGFSLMVLLVWVSVGIGLILWLFNRQDIV